MLAVMFGWLIFRAPDITTLGNSLTSLSHLGEFSLERTGFATSAPLAIIMFVAEWLGRHNEHPLQHMKMPRTIRWLIYIALVFLTLYGMPPSGTEFIYERF